jgi:ribosomal protein S20
LNQVTQEASRIMGDWERAERQQARTGEWGLEGKVGFGYPGGRSTREKGEVDFGRIWNFMTNIGVGGFTGYKELEQAAKQSGLNKEEREAVTTVYRKAVENVTAEFMKSRTGFETVKELARKESAEVGRKFDEAYTKADEVARSTEYKVTTATLNNYMMDKYGQLSPLERVARTHQDLAEAQRKGTREAYEPFLKYMPVEQPSHIEKETAAKIDEGRAAVRTEESKLQGTTEKVKEPSGRGRSRRSEKSPQLREPDTDEFNEKFEKREEEVDKRYREGIPHPLVTRGKEIVKRLRRKPEQGK